MKNCLVVLIKNRRQSLKNCLNLKNIMVLIFIFQIKELVSDEEYRQLQQDLLVQPDKGDLIKNGGGIRKVRCAQGHKGKSGGIRVIYYWVTEDDQIFFLVAYPKSVKDNLTDKETSILRQLVKEQFHG